MRTILTVAALIVASLTSAQDVVVEKDAPKKNPTIRITSWKGSKNLREQMQQDIIMSDWFELTWDGKVDYQIDGKTEKVGTDSLQAEITLTTRDGKAVVLKQDMDDTTWLSHLLVDGLINHVFKNPGFCSTYLAYVKSDGNDKEIWISQFDGSGGRALTKNRSISTEPNWSHDNQFLSYTLYSQTATSIIIYSLDKDRFKTLAHFPGLNAGCALGNTSLRAVMSLSKDGQVDLYHRWVHDRTMTRLTNDSFVEASPTWSPDDSQICYVGSQSRRPTLFLMPSQGGSPERVLSTMDEAVSPDWSRTSNKICFAIRKGGQYAIAVVDMNDPERKVTIPFAAAGDWEAPSWTADGRHIVCSRTMGGVSKLFIVDSWFGTVRELTVAGEGVSLPACSNSFVK